MTEHAWDLTSHLTNVSKDTPLIPTYFFYCKVCGSRISSASSMPVDSDYYWVSPDCDLEQVTKVMDS